MKTITKFALGALMAAGVATAATVPAEAGVVFRVGVPIVAPVYPNTCYDYYGQPYYCGPGYVGGVVIGGGFGGSHYWGHPGFHGGWGHGPVHVLHHI